MPRIATIIAFAAALAAVVQYAAADSYRCGRKLIRNGDSPAEVLRICGQPQHMDRGYETVRVNGASRKLPVERWFYKQGRSRLEHMVVIYRGEVIAIEAGQR